MTSLNEIEKRLEAWRPIAGWEGLYEISSHGRIRALARTTPHWRGGIRRLPARLMSTKNAARYVRITLKSNGREECISVHAAVLEAFVGPRPEGHHACHADGDSQNNMLSNLRWASPRDNNADKATHGTNPAGERNPAAKITAAQAVEIRERYARGDASQSELGREYGLHQTHISTIVRGEAWAPVPLEASNDQDA